LGRQDLKKKAEELQRLALKQVQLDRVQRHINEIQAEKEDRPLQKALLGTLFIWFEKVSGSFIPAKQKISLASLTPEVLLPPMPPKTTREGRQKSLAAHSIRTLQSLNKSPSDKSRHLGKGRNFSHTPLAKA